MLVFTTIISFVILSMIFVLMQVDSVEEVERVRKACYRPEDAVVPVRTPLPRSMLRGVEPDLRIINGRVAPPHKYPWAAAVLDSARKNKCGATVVSDSWLLTAAHCCGARELYVIVGTGDITDVTDSQRRRVVSVVRHPQWDQTCGRNDLALLKLDYPLVLDGETAAAAKLPERDYDLKGVPLIAIGWGLTERGVGSRFLREAVVYERTGPCKNMTAPKLQLCVEDISSGEARQAPGDSGSSVIAYIDSTPVIVAVTSFGPPPVISTRTAPYTVWINDTIK